ncbi:MAG: CoA pyrophosphatase [Planctomycetales bacterium]|nr:CoA pyrophosphatase [Planctomycetales bacterium]
MSERLPELMRQRLAAPLPGRPAQARYAPQLSFGRHFGPPFTGARDAAVALLLFRPRGAGEEWAVPLTLRPLELTHHGGQVSLPGGGIDAGETIEQAALRELSEEIGVHANQVQTLGRLTPLYLYNSHYQVNPCVVVTERPVDFQLNPGEVEELIEIPLGELTSIGRQESEPPQCTLCRRGVEFNAPVIPHDQHRIWGATAMILGEFTSLLADIYPG